MGLDHARSTTSTPPATAARSDAQHLVGNLHRRPARRAEEDLQPAARLLVGLGEERVGQGPQVVVAALSHGGSISCDTTNGTRR